MATNYFNLEDEERRRQEEQAGGATNETVIGGEQSGIIGANVGQQQPQGQQGPSRSGSWTNLNSYLDANRDRQFGQQVAGRVQNEVTEATQKQDEADQGFKQQVQQNRVSYDGDLVNRAVNDPTSFSMNQDQTAAFKKLRDANYGGPMNLSDNADLYMPAQRETDDARDASEASKSEEGRKALLDRFYSRPTYNSGQKALDNLLIQNDEGSRAAFGQAQSAADQALTRFGEMQSQQRDLASQAKAETDATRQQTVGAGEGALTSLQGGVDQRVAQLAAQKAAELAALRTGLGSGDLTPEQYQRLGLSEGTNLYDVDATKYLRDLVNPMAGNVASQDEAARYSALSGLMDRENVFLPEASQAGSYDPSKAYDFDVSGFEQALKDREFALQNELTNTRVAPLGETIRPDLVVKHGAQVADSNMSIPDAIGFLERVLSDEDFALSHVGHQNRRMLEPMRIAAQQNLERLKQQQSDIRSRYGADRKLS